MTAPIAWRRWCSRRFTAVAAAILPRRESPWGDAMKAEIEAIEDDRECLRWAWGCLRTACVRRMGSVLTDHRSVRALVGAYLLLLSIAHFVTLAVYRIGSGPAFDRLSSQVVQREGEMTARMLALAFDSAPAVVFFLVSGALGLASALAVFTRRLRTAAELMIVRLALEWIFTAWAYVFFPAVSGLLLPTHPSLSATIHVSLTVCLTAWLWCARSIERESFGTSAR